jgi:hypothetical protein
MAYLRCPECRLTARATAYFLRGDQCPRCMTPMEPTERFRDASARAVPTVVASREASELAGASAPPPSG